MDRGRHDAGAIPAWRSPRAANGAGATPPSLYWRASPEGRPAILAHASWARLAATILAGALVLVLLVRWGDRRVEDMGGFPERAAAQGRAAPWNDFAVYLGAARALDAPDFYTRAYTPDGRRYVYPPLLACLLRPVASWGVTAAAVLWFVVSVACAAAGAMAAHRVAVGEGASRREVVAAALALVLVAGRFFSDDFGNANANVVVLAATSWGALAFARGRPGPGAFAFALAAALKATPLVVLPWLLARRAWGASGLFLAWVLALSVGVPALWVGPERALDLNATFLRRSLSPEGPSAGDASPPAGGYSLRGALHRTLDAGSAATSQGQHPIALAHVPPATVDALFAGGALALLLGLGWVWARRGREPGRLDGPTARFDLGLVLLAGLLLSPVTRKAHLVALSLPAAVLGWRAFGAPSPAGRATRVARACLVAAAVGVWGSDRDLVGRRLADLAWGTNLLFLGLVALLVGLLAGRPRPVPAAGAAPRS